MRRRVSLCAARPRRSDAVDKRLLTYAVLAALLLVLVVPLEYVAYSAGLMRGGQAAAAWGMGIGVALAFAVVYLRRRQRP